MVEVFKTNVNETLHARWMVDLIHRNFPLYKANFDLDDCDRILRIESIQTVDIPPIIGLLEDGGFVAEVLKDELPATPFVPPTCRFGPIWFSSPSLHKQLVP